MEAHEELERSGLGGGVNSGIVGEFKVWEMEGPVGWMSGAVESKVSLDLLVETFSLSISLGMVCCR